MSRKMPRKYYDRDHFLSGAVAGGDYMQTGPISAHISEQKGANRQVRRGVARMSRKTQGGRRTLSAYLPEPSNEPYRSSDEPVPNGS